ncbi:DUF3566 domain-containing protein [Corynebacterium auris]|uniref:DUF3566 domain-containing protein n=1 Tax=Corynebacterium auris TaxID=44750 RepID=UPI0025B62830|nr:DUF3566 domain-containing protein [Corynebacterium auris]WJY66968.1 hypothetical protein CAURIS_00085 [Corynebacterium auris]
MAARTVTITHVNAITAFKIGSILAVVGFVAWMIAAALVYGGLQGAGVIESMNSLIGGVGGDQVIDFPLFLSAAALLGLVGVVFVAVMSPLVAVMYNAVANLVGGLSVNMDNNAR